MLKTPPGAEKREPSAGSGHYQQKFLFLMMRCIPMSQNLCYNLNVGNRSEFEKIWYPF